MLPRASRMRSASEFRRTIRSGVRAGRSSVVVSAYRADPQADGVRVGFVVSKAVGNAVTRNRVKRRLRHLCRPLVEPTPQGTWVVVRALPPAADAGPELADDLAGAWRTCLKRLAQRTGVTA
ncbi:MAG: ribonuclease P protein component [Propionibacteriaceae bacterium]|nr:ribonuclease P protein component [Propionibacteriaceae bacterium]